MVDINALPRELRVEVARLILEGYGITVKRIRGKEWLYAQKRVGSRVVTKCLGRLVTTKEPSLEKPSLLGSSNPPPATIP